MKKIYILTLALLFCVWTHVRAEEGTTSVPVKMTYVDYSNPDTSLGEIAEGEIAMSGYNSIGGGSVGFGNTGWGVNYITYLQVDVSKISGTITSATLSFDGSQGSTDSKRSTSWGVGYNSSVWSADMTYNGADKSITVIGDEQGGSNKSISSFKTFSFDITKAVNNANEDGFVTILVYETAAAGGHLKNPKVSVNWTTASAYSVNFKETNGVDVTITMDGNNVTTGTTLIDGTYSFTATAPHYEDYNGEFSVEGSDKDVEFEMTLKKQLNFTVKNNVNDEVKTGKCYTDESEKVPYSKYIIAADGTVWKKDAAYGDKNQEYNYPFSAKYDNDELTLEYTKTDMTDGILFIEGEDIEGMEPTTNGNAGVRGSNAHGGFADGAIDICSLKPGIYTIKMGIVGNKGKTLTIKDKDGEEEILSATTQGWWEEVSSKAFTLSKETILTCTGATDSAPLDYILITGEVKPTADYTIKFVDEDGKEIKDAVKGSGFVGSSIEISEEDTKDFDKDGIPYIYDGIEPETPTIAEGGTTVTVKYHKQQDAKYTVKFVDQDGKTLKESVERTGDAGSAATISDEDKEDIVVDDVTYVYTSDDTKDKTYAYDGSTVITITYNKVVGYTIKFVDESGEEIQEALAGKGAIGSEIDLNEYINGITVDDNVYFYVSASYLPEGNTIEEGKVVTLTFKSSSVLPYERTESTWSDADLADWVSADGITKSINDGLNVTWGNTGWSLTKKVNFTKNSIVTLTASMKGGNTGRGGAYEYLELGGVQVRLDGQNRVGTVVIGGEEFTLSGDARGGSVDIEMTIDQATKNATVKVSGSCSGTNSGKITEALPNKVVFGYNKNGSLTGDRTAILKSIAISEELQVVTTADYTINYVFGDETIKSEEGNTVIGNEVTAVSNLTVDDQKYYVTDDATTSMTISGDEENVLNVDVRKAYVYNYVVKNNVNEKTATGECTEGESADVPYSRYVIADDGTVWMKEAAKQTPYTITINPDKDGYETSIEYSVTDMDKCLYFKEAEDMEEMTATTGSNAGARASNAAGGYADEAITVYTLKPGTYTVRIASTGKADQALIVKADTLEVIKYTTNGSWGEASATFTLEEETPITFEGASADTPLDYILITGKVYVPVNSIVLKGKDNKTVSKLELVNGEEYQLTATVAPENATDNNVVWTSSDSEIASVVNGKVTAVGVGKVTITAKAGEKSATCEVKCYPKKGDATWSGDITISDAVDITNYVVGKKTADEAWDADEWLEFYKKGANVNEDEDENITFADASAAVKLTLEQQVATPEQSRISAISDDAADALVISGAAGNAIPVRLANSMEYVALQADIIFPEGMNVDVKAGDRVADSHTMMTKKFADNHIRVAFFNFGNEAFADNDAPILEILTDSDILNSGDIVIFNILASDTNANEYVLTSRTSATSAVAAIGFDANAPLKVFDLNGIYVSDTMEGLGQGTYIVRQGDEAKKVRIR